MWSNSKLKKKLYCKLWYNLWECVQTANWERNCNIICESMVNNKLKKLRPEQLTPEIRIFNSLNNCKWSCVATSLDLFYYYSSQETVPIENKRFDGYSAIFISWSSNKINLLISITISPHNQQLKGRLQLGLWAWWLPLIQTDFVIQYNSEMFMT